MIGVVVFFALLACGVVFWILAETSEWTDKERQR